MVTRVLKNAYRAKTLPALALCFVLLIVAAPIRAQDETPAPTVTPTLIPVFPLRPGSVEGNINDAAPRIRYSFTASAGDSVSIRMESTSGDLDPLLLLYGPDSELVERNDDLQTGVRDAQIALTLARGGTYTVEATRFESVPTVGTFRLTLSIAGGEVTPTPADPLSRPPVFSVPYALIAYQDIVAGTISEATGRRFYAIGGQQGDLVRVTMTRTTGDLSPLLRILNADGDDLSREVQTQAGESIALATLPETGWYLIEAGRREGTGGFDLYAQRIAAAVLEVGQPVINQFTPQTPSISYIVNARFGDLLTATMFTTDAGSGIVPELRLLDVSLNEIAQGSGERFANLRATIPRSGIYILQANTLNTGASGGFNLRLASVPGQARANAQPVSYNDQYAGTITEEAPLDFYRFAGKTGELITLSMNATGGDLNPYLILMDSDLNELAANDDVSTRRDSRITQFRLPKDGEYLILASRSGLERGTTTGSYDLIVTAGEIALTEGGLTATLNWASDADLNLFVTDPSGRVVSWSSPQTPSGGTLQIDSNTGCVTPSDQPVEHAFWSEPAAGDYTVWAWYQDDCGTAAPVDFTLTVQVDSTTVLDVSETLEPGARYEATIRVIEPLEGFTLGAGRIANPSPQQSVSEGGDTLIRYGETLIGTIDANVYARFYQFNGREGDQVEIRAERRTGNLDPFLVLRDADNNNLPGGINDDAGEDTRDARLTYVLPVDGTYIIAVTCFGARDGTTTGDFQLSLARTSTGG